MKPCAVTATRTLEALRGLANNTETATGPGWYNREAEGPYMALNFERLMTTRTKHGAFEMTVELWALSHTYTQNGDLMRDPEVELIRTSVSGGAGDWYGITYRQDSTGTLDRPVTLNHETLLPESFARVAQADISSFMSLWTRNLRHQRPEIAAAHKAQPAAPDHTRLLFAPSETVAAAPPLKA